MIRVSGTEAGQQPVATTTSRRHKRRSGSASEPGTGGGQTNRRSSSSSDKTSSKQRRLLVTLEDAFPTALSVDELARYLSSRRCESVSWFFVLQQHETLFNPVKFYPVVVGGEKFVSFGDAAIDLFRFIRVYSFLCAIQIALFSRQLYMQGHIIIFAPFEKSVIS